MRNRNHSKRTILGAAALTLLFAGSAFTASNTVADHAAGTGSATISGVDVTSINYVLTSTRDQVAEVNFEHENENVANAEAQLQLETDGTWFETCTVTNHEVDPADDSVVVQGTINCTTTGQDFEAANNLTLIVGDNLTVQA